MKMTAGQVYDAGIALARIFNTPRDIPQMAKFKLSRMHMVIGPLADTYELERVKLVQELGGESFNAQNQPTGWQVKEENKPIYKERWEKILEPIIDVKVEPISLAMLGNSAQGIEAHEFRMLGELVVE